MTTKHFRTCTLCEAMCGVVIETEGEAASCTIRGDGEDPFSRGHICPKAVALAGPARRSRSPAHAAAP